MLEIGIWVRANRCESIDKMESLMHFGDWNDSFMDF